MNDDNSVQARHHAGITSVVEHLVEFPPSNQINDFEENPNIFHH